MPLLKKDIYIPMYFLYKVTTTKVYTYILYTLYIVGGKGGTPMGQKLTLWCFSTHTAFGLMYKRWLGSAILYYTKAVGGVCGRCIQ